MANFQDKFKWLLEQDETIANTEVNTETNPEREAMAGTLDKGITPDQFDVPAPRIAADAENKQAQLVELQGWISQIDEFVKFLNEPDGKSMQSKLHDAPCKSIFESIAKAEKKRVARIAAELGSFNQSLKGYLISSND